MKLLDTVVIVGALNEGDSYYRAASKYLERLTKANDLRVPITTLIEFDLLMKSRNYTEPERTTTWLELSPKIPLSKIVNLSPTSLATASELQAGGIGYFDSLITALALEQEARVVTDDKAITAKVKTEW